ncbi:phosphatase PAP2 family protein [Grimontia marina]|nr:phosphatase PAP2 family protein [Grimontia marina]
MTWGNALLAGVIVATDSDERISKAAVENNYLFGSVKEAGEASDDWRANTRMSMHLSTLLVASDYSASGPLEFFERKALRALGNNLNAGFVATTTGDIQLATKKARPNGGCCGFPSAHTSRAFATALIARRNYQQSILHPGIHNTLTLATYLSAYATGWARVESQAHYPSQVLWGAVYGNFVSSLIYDMTNSIEPNLFTFFYLSSDEMMVTFNYQF